VADPCQYAKSSTVCKRLGPAAIPVKCGNETHANISTAACDESIALGASALRLYTRCCQAPRAEYVAPRARPNAPRPRVSPPHTPDFPEQLSLAE